jgi:hypothetical protein
MPLKARFSEITFQHWLSLSGWQLNPKGAAVAVARPNADGSSHPLHGFPNDGQAHAGPFVTRVRVGAFKRFKYLGQQILRDANAVIFNVELNR